MLKTTISTRTIFLLALIMFTLSLILCLSTTLFYFYEPGGLNFGDVLPFKDFLFAHLFISIMYIFASIIIYFSSYRQRDSAAAVFVLSAIGTVFGGALLSQINWEYTGSKANTWAHWVLIGIGLWTPSLSLGLLITAGIMIRNAVNKPCDDLDRDCSAVAEVLPDKSWVPETVMLNKRRQVRLQF